MSRISDESARKAERRHTRPLAWLQVLALPIEGAVIVLVVEVVVVAVPGAAAEHCSWV
jgi:hypothetical protein